MASAADRECDGLAVERRRREGLLSRTAADGAHGGARRGANTAVLVPFWGGTAAESGGNSHSPAERQSKLLQATGTVCSALRALGQPESGSMREIGHTHNLGRRVESSSSSSSSSTTTEPLALVGVCSAEDGAALAARMRHRHGIEPVAVVRAVPVAAELALAARPDTGLKALVKAWYKDHSPRPTADNDAPQEVSEEPPPDSREARLDFVRARPQLLAQVPKLYDLFGATSGKQHLQLVEGTTAGDVLTGAPVTIMVFECAMGVHLPFHLLQAAQVLLTRGAHSSKEPLSSAHVELQQWTWKKIKYIYFTEADQLTMIKDGDVLRDAKAMLNATNYVSPQRLQMRRGDEILRDPNLPNKSLSNALGSKAMAGDAPSFPFTLENECRPGKGDNGWKASVFAPVRA